MFGWKAPPLLVHRLAVRALNEARSWLEFIQAAGISDIQTEISICHIHFTKTTLLSTTLSAYHYQISKPTLILVNLNARLSHQLPIRIISSCFHPIPLGGVLAVITTSQRVTPQHPSRTGVSPAGLPQVLGTKEIGGTRSPPSPESQT